MLRVLLGSSRSRGLAAGLQHALAALVLINALARTAATSNPASQVLFVGDSQCEFLGGIFYSAVAKQTAARLKLLEMLVGVSI